MSDSQKVRFSRDGDQFHYLWAARRCLRLLSPNSGLVAVAIEGASTQEASSGDKISAGEEVIDVAEYYGSENLAQATRVNYLQLKHSTANTSSPWTPSGLKNTIDGFASRYKVLVGRFGVDDLSKRVRFSFVSNRPISKSFLEAIQDAAASVAQRHPRNLAKLQSFTGLVGESLTVFCRLLRLDGGQNSYWVERGLLAQETKAYLPGDDVDAPVQLKELVTRKALSESISNPSVTKTDVLRALGTTEDRLFPAPSRIIAPPNAIPREQEASIFDAICQADAPVIVHASGGVGKSVLTHRLVLKLPKGSLGIVYDCFGNGEYRSTGHFRHRHKDALVQIANELATKGLCDPLIPANADPTAYLRAFVHRLRQAANYLTASAADAVLCIVIDAADNAEMAAKENGEQRSFARDLLREPLPKGVRLVVLCRTERQALLVPPPSVHRVELKPFTLTETAAFLRAKFPEASDIDVAEFHRLSSHNPRVQAASLARPGTLPGILRALGPDPKTVDDTIAALLEKAVAELRDREGHLERSQIDLICAGLAALRPPVPISVLAAVSGVDLAAIRSFAIDLGRPLLIVGDTVQFLDEPAETWFRERFKANVSNLANFINVLMPLATTSAYVASALPQLMLEAGQLDELVSLTLSSSKLPTNSPLDKRDIELQRLRFALKASLRSRKFTEATKLALKAGEETAGNARQENLIEKNTDLAAVLIEPHLVQEIVSRRIFGGGWVGSHHAYEAGLLSHNPDFRGEARSRLRMAHEWIANWARLSDEEREAEPISDDDIAELAIAHLNLHGSDICAAEIRTWTPREISFRVGRIIARKLVDHHRYSDLANLSISSGNNIYLVLGICLEMRLVCLAPPKPVVVRALRLLLDRRVKLREPHFDYEESILQAIIAIAEAGASYGLQNKTHLANLISKYLPDVPPHGITSSYSRQRLPYLRGYALRASLNGKAVELLDLARPELRKEIEENRSHALSRDRREFEASIGGLLPWCKIWADQIVSPLQPDVLAERIAEARENFAKIERNYYGSDLFVNSDIAQAWLGIVIIGNDRLLPDLEKWIQNTKRSPTTECFIILARMSAHAGPLKRAAYDFSKQAFERVRAAKDEAETKIERYVELARVFLGIDKAEAIQYFNQAVDVASKLGDETLDRWHAILSIACQAIDERCPVPETAYRLARCGEVVESYSSKHFDWDGTARAIAGLCPSSAFAVLSRWNDRRFGRSEDLLPTVVHYLLDKKRLDPLAALSLVGFQENWRYSDLLEHGLIANTDYSSRQAILEGLLRYMRVDSVTPSEWKEVRKIAADFNLPLERIDISLGLAVARTENRSRALSKRDEALSYVRDEAEKDWTHVFEGLSLDGAGLSEAFARFKSDKSLFSSQEFFRELIKRIPLGSEPKAIDGISDIAELDLYELRQFFEEIPKQWKDRLATSNALQAMVRATVTKYCSSISMPRYRENSFLNRASEASGLGQEELIDLTLAGVAETSDFSDYRGLFSLVGLLATKLESTQGQEALKYGLALIEETLDNEDGDGPWGASLEPPSEVGQALAGFVWARLAAPKASIRWQAAHVVQTLCALSHREMLKNIVAFAQGAVASPFGDAGLFFYTLHAQQWLIIALARAALDHPSIVVGQAEFLLQQAGPENQQIVIRHFAARALLALVATNHLQLGNGVVAQLREINTSKLPAQPTARYLRHGQKVHPMMRDAESRQFSFHYDMSRYWFENLGECFGQTAIDIEAAAENVIVKDWALTENGYWDRDARGQRGIFRDDERSRSQSDYPTTDDLSFYLSYHAMMVVAGKLLATVPLHQDPERSDDEFEYWLRSHLLTRADGRWLADRRDPNPQVSLPLSDEYQIENWRWSVARSDFDRALGVGQERITLWGDWTAIDGDKIESIGITSALTSPQKSEALLRALQTASNPRDFRIPSADGELEIDVADFLLRGWVDTRTQERGIDKLDPWAGDIRYPALTLAPNILDGVEMTTDIERRAWRRKTGETNREVLWSEVWGAIQEDRESDAEQGRRLQCAPALLSELLRKLEKDLIVNVEINRRNRRVSYGMNRDGEFEYPYPYFKLFLFRASGGFSTLR